VISALRIAALSGVEIKIMVTGVPDKKIPYWAAFTFSGGFAFSWNSILSLYCGIHASKDFDY